MRVSESCVMAWQGVQHLKGGKGGKAPAWVLVMQEQMKEDEAEARRLEKEEYDKRKTAERAYDKEMLEKYGPAAGCNPS